MPGCFLFASRKMFAYHEKMNSKSIFFNTIMCYCFRAQYFSLSRVFFCCCFYLAILMILNQKLSSVSFLVSIFSLYTLHNVEWIWNRIWIRLKTHRKELHGWITQWPAVFCRIRSFTNAFLLPKSFMANRLSVGWNHACNWFLRKFDDGFSVDEGMLGRHSSFGVP